VEKRLAEKYGFTVIDVDRLGHDALLEKKVTLVQTFGTNILEHPELPSEMAENTVNRKKLAGIVFSSRKQLNRLNSIVHPWMVERTRRLAEESPSERILINAALLYEMGLAALCSKIILVTAPWIDIIRRGLKRDRRPLFQILSILMGQKCVQFAKRNRENAEIYSIRNDQSAEKLLEITDWAAEKLLS
jgi:dephospho-CoA kinase